MISRSEVITRAQTIWKPGTVPYSQNAIHQPDGYRQDCSGYASLCWAIPLGAPGSWGGLNTVTLVTNGWMTEIHPSDLKPGDAVGICGPSTGGDAGHIVIFDKWLNDDPNDDHYWLWEQAGGQRGPVHRVVNYPYDSPGTWKAYRFRDITDTPGGGSMTAPGYEPLGYPSKMLLGGQQRGVGLQSADMWGQEYLGGSPYDGAKSVRSNQLDRIEAFAKAAAEQQPVVFSPETIQALAAAVAEAVTQDASAEDIARAIIAQLQPQAQG